MILCGIPSIFDTVWSTNLESTEPLRSVFTVSDVYGCFQMNGRLSGDSGHTSDEIGALEDTRGGKLMIDSPSSQSQSPVTSSSRLGGMYRLVVWVRGR